MSLEKPNTMKKKIVVLISGGGTNLQSLIDRLHIPENNVEICAVIADRPAYGLQRASEQNIPNFIIDRKQNKDRWTQEFLGKMDVFQPDLIVLAGFLSILHPAIIQRYKKKIINIHPALLPKYGGKGMYGLNVHSAVIKAGEKESGCTVHFVDAGVDTGEIILQRKVEVLPDDSPERLQQRILNEEHKILVEAVKKILQL